MTRQESQDLALQFLYTQNKPEWARPIDILLTANIILLSSDEAICFASQAVLAAMSGISKADTVRASLNKLVAHGWITENSRKNQFLTNIYSPMIHNIPFGGFKAKLISDVAKRLAGRYREIVKLIPKKRSTNGRYYGVKIRKGGPQHWAFVMQNWLDEGWSEQDINRVVDHSFATNVDVAKHGPHTLKRKFKKLVEESKLHTATAPLPEESVTPVTS